MSRGPGFVQRKLFEIAETRRGLRGISTEELCRLVYGDDGPVTRSQQVVVRGARKKVLAQTDLETEGAVVTKRMLRQRYEQSLRDAEKREAEAAATRTEGVAPSTGDTLRRPMPSDAPRKGDKAKASDRVANLQRAWEAASPDERKLFCEIAGLQPGGKHLVHDGDEDVAFTDFEDLPPC